MMGAAAAKVLTDLYGNDYTMTDRSHEGLADFVTKTREFKSFEDMAKENALSRILLGVHYRMDCEEGLRLGELIGAEVSAITLETKLAQ